MEINNVLCGWILVEAQLGRNNVRGRACLRGQRLRANEVFEIFLPVSPNGRVHELIHLPDDVTGLSWGGALADQANQPALQMRRLGWFERTWRMANRVFNTFGGHPRQQRAVVGLSLRKVIFDLAGAYRIATELRGVLPYFDWIERGDRLDDEDVQRIRRHIASFAYPPHFHLLLMVDGEELHAIQATLDSLKHQLFRNFSCAVLDVGGSGVSAVDYDGELQNFGLNFCIVAQPQVAAWLAQLNDGLNVQREWVMLLRPGEVLSPHSLYWFASESLARPKATVLYSDDDVLDAEGRRCQPRFKPEWSLEHLRATHFVGDAVVLHGSEVAKAGGVSLDCCRYGNYDLLLRVLDVIGAVDTSKVAHIPAVLLHRAEEGHEDSATLEWSKNALRAHLARNSVVSDVTATQPGCWRVRYTLPEVPPLVSIIVPTRNALDLIRQCVESLLEKTTYLHYEILVVDNQSTEPEVLAYLAQIAEYERVRVLHYDAPFNYSAINNFAAQQARGEVLCLLNNDTEVISPDWLEEMVGHLVQGKVGIVGAKLYYPDGRVQHGGDLVGVGGVANHAHAFLARSDPGYCNRAMVAQDLSAVTAACLVTRRSLYLELGGLDEEHLAVAFNDVDYCLRVREAGYRVVWTPHAELYHHESVSRGKDTTPAKMRRAKREVAYMRKRWRQVMNCDPFYNPNLSQERPDFSLSHMPVVEKPWLK